VPARKEGDQKLLHDFILPDDDLGDFALDRPEALPERSDCLNII
jgi:hypothetical protein